MSRERAGDKIKIKVSEHSNSFFIVHRHALWRWKTFEFKPIRSHYLHLVNRQLHVD